MFFLEIAFSNIYKYRKKNFTSDQISWKVSVKKIIFGNVAGHLLASLLRMKSFTSISQDFIYLLETSILRDTFRFF